MTLFFRSSAVVPQSDRTTAEAPNDYRRRSPLLRGCDCGAVRKPFEIKTDDYRNISRSKEQTMTNLKLADELLSVRQKIKDLQTREGEIKEALLQEGADLSGNYAVAYIVKRASSRFDRKAAEAELGSLERFDVKGQTVALMVNELAQVAE